MARKTRANRQTRYTDDFRASAVLMLEAAGYDGNGGSKKGALSEVSRHLNVPATTLRRWFMGMQNPAPDQLVNEKRLDLVDAIRNELGAIFNEMQHAREGASYRDLSTAVGILTDKLQILTGGPTANENQRVIIEYVESYHIKDSAAAHRPKVDSR